MNRYLDYTTLHRDLDVLRNRLASRIRQIAAPSETDINVEALLFSAPVANRSPYDQVLGQRMYTVEERALLALALAPYVQSNFFESLIYRFFPQGGEIPEIGGARGTAHRGMLPTGETLAFLLAGDDLSKKFGLLSLFGENHFFWQEEMLTIEQPPPGEPPLSGKIILQPGFVELMTSGRRSKPRFGPDFPARLLTTRMDWEDLVLPRHTAAQIAHLRIWLMHNNSLMADWNIGKKIKPGYRALFHGAAGTGKTLTATLLGKQFGKDVYRIDLSQIVSKYIGETEKNLEKVFVRAEHTDCILFFDEADSLFGKRSGIQSAHDKYANQEVSYLLQRVEEYPGIIILASNFKNNLDAAFLRRFNAIISFPMPNAEERYRLWTMAVPEKMTVTFDWKDIAAKYEMSGAAIINTIHFAALRSLSRQSAEILREDILEGIREEFGKEDKFF